MSRKIPDLSLDLSTISTTAPFPSPIFNDINTITDLIQIQSLHDCVSALELSFDKMKKPSMKKIKEKKYMWTAEIKNSEDNNGLEKKYKWVLEVKDGKEKGDPVAKNYKFSAEIKGKSNIIKTYKFEASSGNACESNETLEKKVTTKKNVKKLQHTKVVEITNAEPDRGDVVLRQAFWKRGGKSRGKHNELAPQDAALLIQMSFRAYLIRRSQTLKAFREMAIAKTKLKEIRTLFNNFTYRRRVARDAEELQRFTEKIVELLLTVDAIEGADLMVRATKKSMADDLEAMLDVVDPQPTGRSPSMRKRTFDVPDAVI